MFCVLVPLTTFFT